MRWTSETRRAGPVFVAGLVAFALVGACVMREDRDDTLRRRVGAALDGFVAVSEQAACDELRALGEGLFFGRAGCVACHRVSDRGTRYTGPNLGLDPDCAKDRAAVTKADAWACEPLRVRAEKRHPELRPIEYVVESILDPDHVVVPGYARGVMKRVEEPPVSLSDREILAVATFVLGPGADERMGFDTLEAAREFFGPCRERREQRVPAGHP